MTVLTKLELPRDLHKELKLIALQQKTTIEEIIIEGVEEQIAKYKTAREYVREHFNKYRPIREQVREQVDKYQYSEIQNSREKALKRIEDLRKQGLGYRRIAERLNAEGIPTLSGRGQWHKGSVWKLMK
jgi:hypothetical protein